MNRTPEVLRGLPDPDARTEDGTEPAPEHGLGELERRLGYTFGRRALLRAALTLGSWTNEHPEAGWPSNACLEFFGDAVLDLAAAEAVWCRFPELSEGELTRLRASLVSESALVTVAHRLELGRFLYLGRGDLKRGARDHRGTLADAVEAVLGAVYLDARECGAVPSDQARALFDRWFGERISAMKPHHGLDVKSRLQHWAQGEHRATPVYASREVETGPGASAWQATVELRLPGGAVMQLGTGEATSRKRAEQAAAQAALEAVELHALSSADQVILPGNPTG